MCARRLPWWRKELHLLESSTQATRRSNLGSKSSAHFLAIPIEQLHIPLLQPSQQSSKRTPTCRICAQHPLLGRYSTNTASSIFGGGLPVDRYPTLSRPALGVVRGFSGDGPSQTVLLRSRSPEIGT